MLFEELKAFVEEKIPGAVLGEDRVSTPAILIIKKDLIKQVCELLHTSDKTYFDSLSCLSGVDNGLEENSMEVIYHLYSIPFDLHVGLKVELERTQPVVASVSDVWRTANWHERETYDLLGIHFSGHPDLRRILLPEDWEGHPLRKDYQEQEMYHEVKVKY